MRYLILIFGLAVGACTTSTEPDPPLPPCASFMPALVHSFGSVSAVTALRITDGNDVFPRGNPPLGRFGQLMRKSPQGDFWWLLNEAIPCSLAGL